MTRAAISSLPQERARDLRRIAIGVAPASIAVQICSFASSIALAHVLGASPTTDAYFLGLSVPVVAYAILLAAVRLGAIPALTDIDVDDEGSFSTAASELVTATLLAAGLLTAVTTATAALLLPLLVGDPRIAEMTRWTTLELAPLGIFGALTGALGAILAVRRRFIAPVAVMTIEPVLKTALTVTLGHRIGINALILGNVIGSAAAGLVLILIVRRAGVTLRFSTSLDSRFLRGLLVVSAPLLVAQSVLQVNPLIDRTMASSLAAGSVTALELGLRLFVVPTTLLTATLIGPITATWAARYAADGWPALRQSASRALSAAAVGIPPVVVLGLLLRKDVISLVYSGGAYSGHAVQETASVFGMLVLGLPAQVLAIVYATMFVVHKDTVVPMKIACANVVLNIGLNLALRPLFGVAGIALSTSLTFTVLVGVYALVARRRWGPIATRETTTSALRAAVATIAMAAVVLILLAVLPTPGSRPATVVVLAIVTCSAVAAHGAVFFGRRLPSALSERTMRAGA